MSYTVIRDPQTKRTRLMSRKSALWNELTKRRTEWTDIRDYIIPRAGRFDELNRASDRSSRYSLIYDSTGLRALRVLAAGMMAGMTSPARPWHRLTTPDPDMMEYGPVKVWINQVTSLQREIFAQSNTYNALHTLYEELGAFGTGLDVIVSDFEDVIRHYPMTAGEFALATNERGVVDTMMRQLLMTAEQVVGRFGKEQCSQTVRNLFDSHKYDSLVPVLHYVTPRKDRDTTKRDAKNMRFVSCYFEAGGSDDDILGEGGFRRFPGLAPRWAISSSADVYGDGPGVEAIGDVKQLQHEQLRKAQGIDYQTMPPVQVPTQAKNKGVDMLPGGVSYIDTSGPSGGIKTAFEVRLDLGHLLEDIRDVRERINSTFYVDLFLMLANDTRSNITAREIAERHEEKLLMLGPTLERLHNEMLSPMIDITFESILEAGLVPPPPRELQNTDLKVEFVSTLAQAQRAVGLASVDRLLNTVGTIAAAKQDPAVWDKIDVDQVVDKYSDMLGTDPTLIVPDDEVQAARDARAKQQQAMQAAAMAQPAAQAATAAKTMAETDSSQLADIMAMFSGYTVPGQ